MNSRRYPAIWKSRGLDGAGRRDRHLRLRSSRVGPHGLDGLDDVHTLDDFTEDDVLAV